MPPGCWGRMLQLPHCCCPVQVSLPTPGSCLIPSPTSLSIAADGLQLLLLRTALGSVSQSVVPGPAASASPGNWFKMQIFKAYPTYGVRNLGLGLAFCFWCTAKFDNYCLRVSGNPTQKCPWWYIFPSGMSAARGWLSQGEQKAASPLALIGGNSVMPFRLYHSPLGSGQRLELYQTCILAKILPALFCTCVA